MSERRALSRKACPPPSVEFHSYLRICVTALSSPSHIVPAHTRIGLFFCSGCRSK